jgi:2-polyprenyl-6-hydroxyphenyl methylase/3-demethylubiquinone-9 3-methyltransferase
MHATAESDAGLASDHKSEVEAGDRFQFGENWRRFLRNINEDRIRAAQSALGSMLETNSLAGQTFVDVGSGSGLSSLCAWRLGANVVSFDYDPDSVACTLELKRRFAPDAKNWRIEHGSALDESFLGGLGTFDVVYSWGVLHHTGAMWKALDNVDRLVGRGGRLFIAIYNDEGTRSGRWLAIKRLYNKLPRVLRPLYAGVVVAPSEFKAFIRHLAAGEISKYLNYAPSGDVNERGMTRWRDIIDWVGGYPFEVATPDAIFDFYKGRGYTLTRITCGNVGSGCNEFVFKRSS